MQVKARCVTPAWDSVNAVSYVPGGGPLPDGLYEIDRNGPLASLKLGAVNVFEFDRNCGPDDKPHDYSCKKCGKKFKTLPDLGTHTRTDHKDDPNPLAEDVEDDAPVVLDGRGRKKNKTFTCKTPGCGEVLPNLYALKLHKQEHKKAADELQPSLD